MLVAIYNRCVVLQYCVATIGEGPPFSMIEDYITAQAEHCNKKKKSAKIVEVSVMCIVNCSSAMMLGSVLLFRN